MPPAEISKIFVLDTNVVLHDNNSVRNFKEHDVVIPITVLEELDNFKKGNESVNFHAREFVRIMPNSLKSIKFNVKSMKFDAI